MTYTYLSDKIKERIKMNKDGIQGEIKKGEERNIKRRLKEQREAD